MKQIPKWKLEKIFNAFGTKVTLHVVTKTIVDDQFGQAEESEADHTILVDIQDIGADELMMYPEGMIQEGDLWVIMLPIYTIDGEDIIPKENDYITFKNDKYLIAGFEDDIQNGNIVSRRAIARRQVVNG